MSATPAQVVAAVWSSIIHGARGIVYFNHSFGGPCVSASVLREACYAQMRAEVRRLNTQITTLAPVLNAPFADGVVQAAAGADVATKWYARHFYLIAGATGDGPATVSFAVPCVGTATATVLDEHRSIAVTNGGFTDRFADQNTVHRYRIDGGWSCGL